MSDNDIYTPMIQHRGAAYRDDQVTAFSHYGDPIDHREGRLAGRSHVWGDASPEVQSRVIDLIVSASAQAGLDARHTAYVLAIARVESGFNPDAAAGTTSAYGLGQFIDRTAAHYGINDNTRGDVEKQAEALVAHYVDNDALARSRHQGEAYIYKYHHDGPTRDYGGLALSEREVMPYIAGYEGFIKQHWPQLDRGAAEHAVSGVLHHGARGETVMALQTGLANLDYTGRRGRALRADGDFGMDTLHAVEAFQRDHGLTVDGKVGPHTKAAMRAATDARKMEASVVCDEPAPLMTFSDPAHPQHALHAALREALPAATTEARLAQATAACHLAGIDSPGDLSGIYSGGTGTILFTTNSLFANMAEMDVGKPAPTVQQTMLQVQQFDRRQTQAQRSMQQQPNLGPVLRP